MTWREPHAQTRDNLKTMKRSRTPVDLTVPQIVERVGVVERIGVYWTDGDQGSATATSVQAAVAADPTLRGTTSMTLPRPTSPGPL